MSANVLGRALRFTVAGPPVPQGSKKSFIHWVGGKPRAVLKDDNEKALKAWRRAVAKPAAIALSHRQDKGLAPFDGPMIIQIEFRFQMPKTRPKASRLAGTGRKFTAPDVDKLCRAVFDGLEDSRLITNDARFCDLRARKFEVTDPTQVGAVITIAEILDDPAYPQPEPTLGTTPERTRNR